MEKYLIKNGRKFSRALRDKGKLLELAGPVRFYIRKLAKSRAFPCARFLLLSFGHITLWPSFVYLHPDIVFPQTLWLLVDLFIFAKYSNVQVAQNICI